MVGEKDSWSSSNNSGWRKQWTNISTSDSINNQNLQYKIISNPSIDIESQNQSFHTKLSKTECSSLSVIRYSESIHKYLHIWIIRYSNAFLIFVCFHISSLSFIQSIQIIMSLILFPESINKMLSLIYDKSDISNNMIITVSCSFPFWDNNTHECFNHCFHYLCIIIDW